MKKKEVHVELFGNETQLFEVRIINFHVSALTGRSHWTKISFHENFEFKKSDFR